ncbi:unnamed protein product [Closterium sp. Naga37s-1]|nr:unnamed protein product [Closterium sp. Naga37s-1]
MKGLIMNCMEKKTQAYELVRKGLKFDLSSHVCWHVYGLLYRSDRLYRDAIKCYLNALRIDPNNQQILKDLSLLQVQMRDTAGFVESRRQLLTFKPNHRANWLAFAVANHINGRLDVASQILSAYEGTVEDESPPDGEKYEHSEMLLYKVSLLAEAGKHAEALEELGKKQPHIVDKLGVREQRAELLHLTGRSEEARSEYEALLAINPDNYKHYEGLQACMGLNASAADGSYTPEQLAELSELFKGLQEKYPKSAAAKRIPLDFLQGAEFEAALQPHVRRFIRKGIPSLFTDLEPLYDQPGKADIMDKVFTAMLHSIRSSGKFPPLSDSSAEEDKENPSVLLWLLYLMAQHLDRRGKVEEALAIVDEAIAHTPTLMDAYLVKARILDRAGDFTAAARLADEARSLDLADRYLNSEAVRHMLRADQVDLAEKTAALFTKHGDQHENLFDMQCMWYELAGGDSYLRQKNYGRALKNYLSVHKHYNDMIEDQFDFHTYCLRKMTLRAYVATLRWEDSLHASPFFCQGAVGAVRTYVALHDRPVVREETKEEERSKMSAAERKRLQKEQRRKKEEEEAAAAAAAAAAAKAAKKGGSAKPVDADPDGVKLTEVEDKLAEASKHLSLLLQHAGSDLSSLQVAFDVFSRKKKLLLCLQVVLRLLREHPHAPLTHSCLVRFFLTVRDLPAAESESDKIVRAVIEAERAGLGLSEDLSASLQERNEAFLESHKDSLPHRAAAAEAMAMLDPSLKARATSVIHDSQEPLATSGGALAEGVGEWSLDQCVAVHRLLQEGPLADEAAAQRWKDRCAERFPYSQHFEGGKSSVKAPPPVADGVNEDVEEGSAAGAAARENGVVE